MPTDVIFDTSKLRGRVKEVFGTDGKFAEAMGCGSNTMSAKLNGKSEFSQKEIIKAVKLLLLSISDIPSYFFVLKV